MQFFCPANIRQPKSSLNRVRSAQKVDQLQSALKGVRHYGVPQIPEAFPKSPGTVLWCATGRRYRPTLLESVLWGILTCSDLNPLASVADARANGTLYWASIAAL